MQSTARRLASGPDGTGVVVLREPVGDREQEPRSGALGLHEGICDPRTGCTRWPEHLKLLNETTGQLVDGRCRATNLCRYCQALYVLETVEMLSLDATEFAPTLWCVLTAREHLTRSDCYSHLRQLRAAAKKRWPAIEWFVQVEFQRRGRLHLNLLIKGVPVEDLEQLREVMVGVWCRRVDALPGRRQQWFGEIDQGAEGVIRYLQKTLSHGLKREQAPPLGWKGHRTSQTRGYLVRPASVMRQEARRSLALKRELWRAMKAGHQGHDAELVANLAIEQAAAETWRLFRPRLVREGVNDETTHEQEACASARSLGPQGLVGGLDDSPGPLRVGDRLDVDVTPASQGQDGQRRRRGRSPAAAPPPDSDSPPPAAVPNGHYFRGIDEAFLDEPL